MAMVTEDLEAHDEDSKTYVFEYVDEYKLKRNSILMEEEELRYICTIAYM